jgi:hypothetical protein
MPSARSTVLIVSLVQLATTAVAGACLQESTASKPPEVQSAQAEGAPRAAENQSPEAIASELRKAASGDPLSVLVFRSADETLWAVSLDAVASVDRTAITLRKGALSARTDASASHPMLSATVKKPARAVSPEEIAAALTDWLDKGKKECRKPPNSVSFFGGPVVVVTPSGSCYLVPRDLGIAMLHEKVRKETTLQVTWVLPR